MSKTVPGGYYLGTDGKPHNAAGEPVKEQKPQEEEAPDQAPVEDEDGDPNAEESADEAAEPKRRGRRASA